MTKADDPKWVKKKPTKYAKGFESFFGLDDISSVYGYLDYDSTKLYFDGQSIFEIMYSSNELPTWKNHNWLHLRSERYYVYILEFDEYPYK